MGKIVYTSNIPFDMRDWERRRDVISVSAGRNCAMAILNDGTVLRKTCISSNEINSVQRYNDAQTHSLFGYEHTSETMNQHSFTSADGREHFKQVAVSQYAGLVAAGLREDGICVAWVDPEKSRLRPCCDCKQENQGMAGNR